MVATSGHNKYYKGGEDPQVKEVTEAMARLTISEQTHLTSRSSSSPMDIDAEPTRVKQTLKDAKSSYKRKWEAANPASVTRSDSLGPDSKRRRVDLKDTQNAPFTP